MGKAKRKTPEQTLDISRYIDLPSEAERYEVDPERAQAIAERVERSGEPTFTVAVTRTESEFRERLERVYNDEVTRLQTCPWPDCEYRAPDIYVWIAHQRMHLVLDCPDMRVRAKVLDSVEATLAVKVERTGEFTRGALPLEERQRLLQVLGKRGLLPPAKEN